MSLGPPTLPPAAPKMASPGVNGGMAFSPAKPPHLPAKPHPEVRVVNPPPPPVLPPKIPLQKLSWAQPIQVPGQQITSTKAPELPPLDLGSLGGTLFGETTFNAVPVKKIKEPTRSPSQKRDKSPVRVPVVNTFAQQAQLLEQQERASVTPPVAAPPNVPSVIPLGVPTGIAAVIPLAPTKIGRQLSNASRDIPTQTVEKSDSTSTLDSMSPEDSSFTPKSGFFSHFRKRARKRISVTEETMASPDAMPVSPIPQLQPIQIGDDKSLRNSIVMEDFFEDARDHFTDSNGDLLRQVDEVLASGGATRTRHITIAPMPVKGAVSSHPPSSHKGGGAVPPPLPSGFTRHAPSPYPANVSETPSPGRAPPLAIPKRGSSRQLTKSSSTDSVASRPRRPNATPSPLPRILDDINAIPGAYPLSSSPDNLVYLSERRPSIPMSRSTTNISLSLPGAYPRERSRYNSSSSGLSSAASYRTACDQETWETEIEKQREEQLMLQQSLLDATKAMRTLEKYSSLTDLSERHKHSDTTVESPSAWPTPPYEDKPVKLPPKGDIDYFRIGEGR